MTFRRWWTLLLALGAATAVAVASSRVAPHAGLHGSSLGLTLALTGFVVGVLGVRAAMLVRWTGRRVYLPVLALLAVSSAALVWLQPTGPGLGVGVGTAVILAARALPVRFAAPAFVIAVCLAALAVAYAVGPHSYHRSGGLVGGLPFGGAFLLAALIWRMRLQRERSDRLVALMAETRDAELRAAALAERQRLARDMHDVLAHSLSGLVVQLEGARLLLASDPSDGRLAGVIDRAHRLAKSGLDEARSAIGMLRDDELPGPERLARLAGEFAADTGVPCRFTTAGQPRELDSVVRLALYRVAQEGLTNVRKHAHPDRAEVRLEYQPDTVSLTVEDFGPAPAGSASAGGYGLGGMRERAELLGGTLTAGPTGTGFRVRLAVPA